MSFIDGIMFLPDELEIEYEKEVKEKIGGGEDMVAMELTNLYRTGINVGRMEGITEGIEKGIAEGMEKGVEKVALSMFENGLSIEMVEKMTGLKREKIEEIAKQVKHN
jgi:predicted transposase/invertase (TIGR01784 family)